MTIKLEGQVKRSGWGSIGAGLGKGLGEGLEIGEERRQEAKQKKEAQEIRNQENEFAAREFGIDLRGVNDAKMRQQLVASELAGRRQQEKSGYDAFTRGQQDRAKHEHEREMLNERENLIGQRPPKEPKKTQASQPIDPDQIDKIQQVRNDPGFEKASPSKKYQMFTDKGVSKENAKAEADIYSEEEKVKAETRKAEAKENQRQEDIKRQEKELFHKESHNFDEKLKNDAKTAQLQNRSLQRQMENVDKLGFYDRAVSLLGNSAMGTVLKSKNAQEFDANTLYQMEGLRQILGGVLSDSDIRLLLQKIVTSDKNPEANKTIAKNMMFENNLKIAKDMIGNEIRSSNGGYRPANYESEIEKIYQERYENSIQEMFNEVMSLSDDKKKINEFRRKVPPGTSLNDNSVKMYYELANGDPEKATKLAEEDGYDIPK